MDVKAKVIAQPEKGFREISNSGEDIPILIGGGDTNYLCGNCDNVICKNVNPGQICSFELVCPRCGCKNSSKEI